METLGELVESNFLHCKSCSRQYASPCILPCLHTFCRSCIQTIIENPGTDNSAKIPAGGDHSSQQSLTCPLCKSAIGILPQGAEAFPVNTFIQDLCDLHEYKHENKRVCEYCKYAGRNKDATSLCLDCHDDMCQECTDAHQRTKVTRDHKVVPYAQIQNGYYDQEIRQYQQHQCRSHDNRTLSKFCTKCECMICQDCKISDHDDHKWTVLEEAVPKYSKQIEGLLTGIQRRIPSIQEYLKFLNTYCENLDENKEKLSSSVENQANLLHTMVDEYKGQLLDRISQACITEKDEIMLKTKNLEIAVSSLQDNEDYLGRLVRFGKPDEILALHHQITCRLTQLVHMQVDGISKKLRQHFTVGTSTKQNVETLFGKLVMDHVPLSQQESSTGRRAGGLMTTTVLPNVRNEAELIMSFDAEGKCDAKDVWPTGLAITNKDEFVIVDRDNKKVKIFDEMGKLKQEIKGGAHSLGCPFDVAVLRNGNIAVTDYDNEDVKVFTPEGEFVMSIKGHLNYPRGITVNSKGEIIVVDCRLQGLTIYDPTTGELIKTIEGRDESGSKILVDPYYVSVTSNDHIVVTDTAAPNIKVFSSDGKYLGEYGNYGTRDDEILQPYGVCNDDYGYMIVADNKNHRIHLLLPDGKLSKFLLTKSDGLWHPMGLAITKKGFLAITEALGKVRVFRYI